MVFSDHVNRPRHAELKAVHSKFHTSLAKFIVHWFKYNLINALTVLIGRVVFNDGAYSFTYLEYAVDKRSVKQ